MNEADEFKKYMTSMYLTMYYYNRRSTTDIKKELNFVRSNMGVQDNEIFENLISIFEHILHLRGEKYR